MEIWSVFPYANGYREPAFFPKLLVGILRITIRNTMKVVMCLVQGKLKHIPSARCLNEVGGNYEVQSS